MSFPEEYGAATDLASLSEDTFLLTTSKGYILRYNKRLLDTPLDSLRACKGSLRRLLLIDSSRCLVCTAKGKLFLVDLASQQSYRVKGSFDAIYTSMALLSSVGDILLALGTEDGDIHCVRVHQESGPLFRMVTASAKTLSHHDDYISELAWVGPKKTLVATSGDGLLSVISVKEKEGEPIARLVGQSRNYDQDLTALALLPAGGKLLAAGMLGWLGMFQWNYWGSTCASLKKSIHKEAPITQLHVVDEDQGIVLSSDGEGLLRLVAIKPMDGTVMVVADLGESIERSLLFSDGPDKLVVAITASGSNLHSVTLSSTIIQTFINSLCPGEVSVVERKKADESNSDSAFDSDIEEEEKSKKRDKKKPKTCTIANTFFSSLD